MSAAAHSPGPWQVFGHDGDSVVRGNGLDMELIACHTRPANARLIAAAPELEDALRQLLACLNGHAAPCRCGADRAATLALEKAR